MRICLECGNLVDARICPRDGCPTLPEDVDTGPQNDTGRLIAGKYRALDILGEGGMGLVYRAYQRDMRRVVALKVARLLPSDPNGVKRFLREARAVAGLQHPNTIRMFDYGELEDGRPFFTMELLDGEPLARLLERGERFDDRRMLRIAIQVLKSLGEAHRAGIIHRDLSPDNIFLVRMFREPDFVKVLDFGVATGAFSAGTTEERLTLPGIFVGKPSYTSPEMAEGREDIDPRSDLYSLGVILYQLASGRVPFQSATPMKLLIAHIEDAPDPLDDIAPEVDPGLRALIMRLLSKSRNERPDSADDVLNECEAIAARLTVPGGAAPAVPPPRAHPPGFRRAVPATPIGMRPGLEVWYARHRITLRLMVLAIFLVMAAATATWLLLAARGDRGKVAAPPAPAEAPVPGPAAPEPEVRIAPVEIVPQPTPTPTPAPAPTPAIAPARPARPALPGSRSPTRDAGATPAPKKPGEGTKAPPPKGEEGWEF